ncbi:hypothetical protein A1507_01690 [Methylomonas koyamae]|uniref:Uncharacterized protein n=1 Tax=Methylomonas koyamae TaxID=702114 RepID=A0A177N424_9GAMM|nr:hypothetical protein A1507_01690 [Methylomonas koyamae]
MALREIRKLSGGIAIPMVFLGNPDVAESVRRSDAGARKPGNRHSGRDSRREGSLEARVQGTGCPRPAGMTALVYNDERLAVATQTLPRAVDSSGGTWAQSRTAGAG